MTTPIADYVEERALFDALLLAETQHRILLFQGESGMGKSRLLMACLEKVTSIRHIPVDFKGTAVSVAEVFYRTGDRLGWEHFPHFLAAIGTLEGPQAVKIDSNRLLGINQKIELALTIEKVDDRERQVAELTKAWFGDLLNLGFDLLFIFDTYEQATEPVQRWLAGPFLVRAAGNPRLRVLIAGQKVPESRNIEWGYCCQTRQLAGVRDPAHWESVVTALNRHIPYSLRDYLAGICQAYSGRPDAIMNFIEGLPQR